MCKDGDVPLIRRFIEGLLDYLYWGPASLDELTQSFELRKKIAKGAEVSEPLEARLESRGRRAGTEERVDEHSHLLDELGAPTE